MVLYNGKSTCGLYLQCTVKPVYNGPVLSGQPLLSGQFLKSLLFAHTNAVFVTCIIACERRRISGCQDSLRRKMLRISTAGNTSAFAGYLY